MDFVVTHPLDPEDAAIVRFIREASRSGKGKPQGIEEARGQFDALMESVLPRDDVKSEAGAVGGIPGIWIHPGNERPDEAIIHLHGGWFNFGSAKAYRYLVGHIAAKVGARAFIPDYRLAPEHPFPAAVDDVMACYRGFGKSGVRRVAVTGDSAGGNLALVLASQAAGEAICSNAVVVGVAALSPVTDLTLSGASYVTRADADPFFSREQVAAFVYTYLGQVDPKHPLASPLYGSLSGLPPIHIHVGDDEVLLDDSSRYVERAVSSGVDARLDVWMGMPHGFPVSIGKIKVAAQALDSIGAFLSASLSPKRSFSMTIAIIGLGNIGSRVAKNLTAGGQNVILSDRNTDKAVKVASELGSKARAMAVDDALRTADLIVLAIYFDAIKEFIATHRKALAGKIVVDPSNPIAPDEKGGFRKIIPADQSAGEIIAGLLPEGSELVKAFGTLTAESLSAGANRSPERAVLFYATDYPEAGRVIAKMITASGFAPVSVGGIDQSVRVEAFGDLHQFGKLGRLVSVKEAEALV